MDYSELVGDIRKKYRTMEAFAMALGISKCSLSKKLNDRVEWTAGQMRKACELLGKGPEMIPLYFFTPDVEKTQQR